MRVNRWLSKRLIEIRISIAGIRPGLLFIMSPAVVLFGLVQMPPPEGSPAALFMGALGPTGYMTFVKILELVGGVLVTIPRTRNFGLLALYLLGRTQALRCAPLLTILPP